MIQEKRVTRIRFSGSFYFSTALTKHSSNGAVKKDSANTWEAFIFMEQTNSALANGKLFKLMLKFSIPCVLSLLVSSLYNVVDQIFIGNSRLGDLGNAATGVVFPIFLIAQAFAWWFGDGCAAYLNICQGKNTAQNAHRAMGTGITLTLLASAVILAVFYPIKRPFLLLFGASENSIEYAVEYFDIVLAFFPPFMLMNAINGIIRADGSPAWSMASIISGALVNIALDAVFIFALDMGMAGAAWATGLGQIVSFAVSAFYLFRKTKTFKLSIKSFVPDFKQASGAVKLGLSSFITQTTIVAISLVCNITLKKYGALSPYGEDIPLAVMAIESKVFTVVINIVVGIILGCQPLVSYNMGAKNYDRVKRIYLSILLCAFTVGILSTLVFELAPRAVAGIFGAPKHADPVLYWEFAEKLFRIFLMFITFTCYIKVSSIFFQAAGKPVSAVASSLIRDIVCFIPLALSLPLAFGIDGVLYAAPAADAIAAIVAVVFTVVFFRSLSRAPAENATVEPPCDAATEKLDTSEQT